MGILRDRRIRAEIERTRDRHPAVCAASHAAQAKEAARLARGWAIASLAGAGVVVLIDCLVWAGVIH